MINALQHYHTPNAQQRIKIIFALQLSPQLFYKRILVILLSIILFFLGLIVQLYADVEDLQGLNSNETDWVQTNGPYGGDIRALFVTSEGVLFAGTENSGIFRSTDLGDSWTSANVGLPDALIGEGIAISAFGQKGNTIYASVAAGKLYASTDLGNTWHVVPHVKSSFLISGIVIVGTRMYMSAYQQGVWYLDDEKSWTLMNEGLTNFGIRAFANIGTTLVVGTEDGAFRKKSTEKTWQPINSGFSMQPIDTEQINRAQVESGLNPSQRPFSQSGIHVNAIAAMDNFLYMSVNMGKDRGLFRSDDEGDSWTRITANEMKHTVEALAVYNKILYASTFGGIFRSNDKGDTWIPVSKGITNPQVTTLVAVSDNNVFAGTSGSGIFRTTDGGKSWAEANTGLTNTSVSELEVLGDKIYALADNGLLYSRDGGESWESVEIPSKPIDFSFSALSVLNGKLYVGAMRFAPRDQGGVVGGVFRLDEQTNSLIELKTDRRMYGIQCMTNIGKTFYVGTQGKGVFLWTEAWDSWLSLGLEGQFIIAISVNENSVYVGTIKGQIFRLANHEKPWQPIYNNVKQQGIWQLRWVDFTLYALSHAEGLIRSDDGGDSWIPQNNGLSDKGIDALEIDGSELFLGTLDQGVFKWSPEDEKWKQIGSLRRWVQSLAVFDGFLYAGTGGAGVFRIKIEK